MQTQDSIDINRRFFEAIDFLVQQGRLQGRKTFATIYDLNWGNFYRLRKEPQREFQLWYLARLVSDFDINATWLLTGAGSMLGSTSQNQ